jgi:predicted DNA-binding protein with PD1-like motif
MQAVPLRLVPGDDLRGALEAAFASHGAAAGFVLQGIGSLSAVQIRFAGLPHSQELRGDMEILTLAGSLSPDGAHLHISVADAQGHVTGGHLDYGALVRTTAEVLLALLPQHAFSRAPDPSSGFNELVVSPRLPDAR